jgi:hypothetical protein
MDISEMKKVIVVLTGGLGNQLFQMQFAKHIQSKKTCKVYFDIALGKPRGESDTPDSFHFGVPGEVIKSKESKSASKAIGYILRSSYAPTRFEKTTIHRFFAKFFASTLLSIHFRTFMTALSPRDLGFDKGFDPKVKHLITMGYFQSYLFSDKNARDKKTFSIFPQSESIDFYKDLAAIEKPIIVHVRRSDYASEENFGLLGPKYYERAIDEVFARVNCNKIWLFSDEPNIAITLLPERYQDQVRIIEEIDNSPANTLEVMRLGTGYVVANSTFSWWAAFSSYLENPVVAAPEVWFKNMNSPNKLIPSSWIKFDSDFL